MNYGKIIMFCFLVFSCSTADEIPIAPATHIPLSALWTQVIDRRINYLSSSNEIIEENILNISNILRYSVNASFTKAPKATVYENYSAPFSFQMKISELNGTIEKIKLEQCLIENSNNEIKNILEIPLENISINFSWRSNDGHRSWFPDEREFNDTMIIEIEKKDDEYISGIYFHFKDIPINYENDALLSIVYKFLLYTHENEIIEIKHKIQYTRRIEELKMFYFIRNLFPNDQWREISIEEWKKYL
jgi:hypothetical protein